MDTTNLKMSVMIWTNVGLVTLAASMKTAQTKLALTPVSVKSAMNGMMTIAVEVNEINAIIKIIHIIRH